MCDLFYAEATQKSERKRNLVLWAQRRMATGEDQPEFVVGHRCIVSGSLSGASVLCGHTDLLMELPASDRTSMSVDCTVLGSRYDPSCRVRRSAISRPFGARNDESVLNRVFGDSDIAKDANQGRHGLSICVTEHALNLGHVSIAKSGVLRFSVTP